MTGSFDPYHKWLGIPPKDQPPNHYRLLAIDLFESDPDVIASAADQRMAHVRSFQTGRHAALSQRVLNEIAAARVCLLNPEKKAAYDRKLGEQLGVVGRPSEPLAPPLGAPPDLSALPPAAPVAPPLDEAVPPGFEGMQPRPWVHRRRHTWEALVAVLVAAVLLGAVLAVILMNGGREPVVGDRLGSPPGTLPGPAGRPNAGPEPGGPAAPPSDRKPEPGPADKTPPQPADVPEPPLAPAQPPPQPSDQGPPKTPVEGEEQKPPPPPPPEGQPQKLPVPDPAAQTAAQERLKGAFPNASATELRQAGRAADRTPEERFVLLAMARDAAAAAGDVDGAFQATEELAARYAVDVLDARVQTFDALGGTVTTSSVVRVLVEKGLGLVDQATADKKADLAKRLATQSLSLARKSGDTELINRVTLKVYEVLNPP